MTDSQSYPDNVEAIRHALHSAIDSPVIEALARLFHPNILVVGNSYSESVMDILAPRLIAELGAVSDAQTAQVFEEPRNVSAADREYASELLADLTSDDLPDLEIAARWFRKARVEHSLPGNHAQTSLGLADAALQRQIIAPPDIDALASYLVAAGEIEYSAHAKAVLAPTNCDWPDAPFTFLDEPGEHDPCYVVMPGGAMLSLNHHAMPGVDIARAKFIVDACNAALSPDFPRAAIAEAMQDAWNTICADTDCHPLDIERQGKKLFFKPGHWVDLIALFLSRSPSVPTHQTPYDCLIKELRSTTPKDSGYAETAADAIEALLRSERSNVIDLPADVIAAVVGGGITSNQVTKVWGLIRAALELREMNGSALTSTDREGEAS